MKINDQAIAEQARHKFSSPYCFFDRDVTHSGLHLIEHLEVEAACRIPEKGGFAYHGGVLRVAFVGEATVVGRARVRRVMTETMDGAVRGTNSDPWFCFEPSSGIVSHDLVRGLLSALYASGAITTGDATKAAALFGVVPPEFGSRPDVPVSNLYDIDKPEVDAEVAELAASLTRSMFGR